MRRSSRPRPRTQRSLGASDCRWHFRRGASRKVSRLRHLGCAAVRDVARSSSWTSWPDGADFNALELHGSPWPLRGGVRRVGLDGNASDVTHIVLRAPHWLAWLASGARDLVAAAHTRQAWVIALIVVLLVSGCGGSGALPAPPVSGLPIAQRAQVVASASGGSQIDSTLPGQWRYIALAGPANMLGAQLMVTEVRRLRTAGWRPEQSMIFKGDSGIVHLVAITAPGALVELDSPTHNEYVAIQVAATESQAQQILDGTPIQADRAVQRALRDRRPVLAITLGNGKFERVTAGAALVR